MAKDWAYVYCGYRPVEGYVVRVKVPKGESLLSAYDAEVWNYTDKAWVPSDSALEDVKYDNVNTTNLTKEDVENMLNN